MLPACYTGLSTAPGGADEDTGDGGSESETDDDADGEPSRPDPAIGEHHTAIGLRRLSKLEYGSTVRDLLGVEEAETGLPDDQKVGSLSNNAHAKQLGLAELEAFSRAAEDASAAAVPSLELGDGCTPDQADGACVTAWLPAFLRRAFRRAVSDAEVGRYADLFAARVAAGDPPAEALRLVLEAVLMSPHFLYRPELGTAGAGQAGALTSYEIASRLSYLVWGTMPDDALLDAAEADTLHEPTAVTMHADRIILESHFQHAGVHPHHHIGIHLNKATVRVPSKAWVIG